MVEAQVADRYQKILRLRRVLRLLMMPIDLLVTSEALYDSRAQVPGTVEFASLPAHKAGCSMRAIEQAQLLRGHRGGA